MTKEKILPTFLSFCYFYFGTGFSYRKMIYKRLFFPSFYSTMTLLLFCSVSFHHFILLLSPDCLNFLCNISWWKIRPQNFGSKSSIDTNSFETESVDTNDKTVLRSIGNGGNIMKRGWEEGRKLVINLHLLLFHVQILCKRRRYKTESLTLTTFLCVQVYEWMHMKHFLFLKSTGDFFQY